MSEPYENTLSIEELRRELRRAWDTKYAILDALRDAPEFPPAWVLKELGGYGRWPEDSNRGKELQRKHGSDVIPYKSECETGAGLWDRIRRGLTSKPEVGV